MATIIAIYYLPFYELAYIIAMLALIIAIMANIIPLLLPFIGISAMTISNLWPVIIAHVWPLSLAIYGQFIIGMYGYYYCHVLFAILLVAMYYCHSGPYHCHYGHDYSLSIGMYGH